MLSGRFSSVGEPQTISTSANAVNPTQRLLLRFEIRPLGFQLSSHRCHCPCCLCHLYFLIPLLLLLLNSCHHLGLLCWKEARREHTRDSYSRFDVETPGSCTRKLSPLGNHKGLLIQHWKGCLDWAWPLTGFFIIVIHSQICVLGQSRPCPYHQWSLPPGEGLTSGKAGSSFSRQKITNNMLCTVPESSGWGWGSVFQKTLDFLQLSQGMVELYRKPGAGMIVI